MNPTKWLLGMPALIGMLPAGRPEALAVADIDHLPLIWIAVGAFIYAYWAERTMANMVERLYCSKLRPVRACMKWTAHVAAKVPKLVLIPLIVAVGFAPTVGFWLQAGLAVNGFKSSNRLPAFLMGFSTAASMVTYEHFTRNVVTVSSVWRLAATCLALSMAAFLLLHKRGLDRRILAWSLPHLRLAVRASA
jgi:hypothetical protein